MYFRSYSAIANWQGTYCLGLYPGHFSEMPGLRNSDIWNENLLGLNDDTVGEFQHQQSLASAYMYIIIYCIITYHLYHHHRRRHRCMYAFTSSFIKLAIISNLHLIEAEYIFKEQRG
jgi:hypothetical protein